MSTIVVSGDLVWDTNLTRLQRPPKDYGQPHNHTQLQAREGGAWYLAALLKQALASESTIADVSILKPDLPSESKIQDGKWPGIANGFSVWEWMMDDRKKKLGAWRIAEFLGCQSEAAEAAAKTGSPLPERPIIPIDPHECDLLVIDDLKLGFADHQGYWPASLADAAKGAKRIVAKAKHPFMKRPLWETLLSDEWAGKLTVVVSSTDLREAGARVSRSLSWDQTVADLQREFSGGGACTMFDRCERVVVWFGHFGAASFCQAAGAAHDPSTLRFEEFIFDPTNLEEPSKEKFKGRTFGQASAMVATLTTDYLLPTPRPIGETLKRGLAAAQILHEIGGGETSENLDLRAAEAQVFKKVAHSDALKSLRSAVPSNLTCVPDLTNPGEKCSLLVYALEADDGGRETAARAIVQCGRDEVLANVPRLTCGKYFTVDRDEIERLNAIRNLITDYKKSTVEPKPLSLAVFGSPGSGKSFAIKNLATELFEEDKAVLEFNLSQFASVDDLHEAFHEVRDKSMKSQIPFVFWDEFDTKLRDTELGWLKEFLAPMQDSQFFAKGKGHPFAKCIFIFAGGTCETFGEFDRSARSAYMHKRGRALAEDPVEADVLEHRQSIAAFKNVKGPDFVSRLRGYVNIKGPNRVKREPSTTQGKPGPDVDPVHIIRRALLLRAMIEKHHGRIVNPATGEIDINDKVLNALLLVEEYRHGARSLENLISLCRLHSGTQFLASDLPPREVVDLHVTDDFWNKIGH